MKNSLTNSFSSDTKKVSLSSRCVFPAKSLIKYVATTSTFLDGPICNRLICAFNLFPCFMILLFSAMETEKSKRKSWLFTLMIVGICFTIFPPTLNKIFPVRRPLSIGFILILIILLSFGLRLIVFGICINSSRF